MSKNVINIIFNLGFKSTANVDRKANSCYHALHDNHSHGQPDASDFWHIFPIFDLFLFLATQIIIKKSVALSFTVYFLVLYHNIST